MNGQGVRTYEGKVLAVQDWPQPKTVSDVRSFLRLTGFYQKYVQGYAGPAGPLTDLLRVLSVSGSSRARHGLRTERPTERDTRQKPLQPHSQSDPAQISVSSFAQVEPRPMFPAAATK